MKQLGIASFTANGSRIADALAAAFETEYEIVRYEKGLKDWCGGLFAAHADGIIFVGACGIAVRTIAPFLVSKTTDPAVLVIDEKGQFVISLLSGHIGGANRLALRAADVLRATPVITTATDVNGKFAVDVFASDNRLRMDDMRLAKEISAAILRGENVGVYCEGEIEGEIPPELTLIGSRLWSGRIPDPLEESGVAAHLDAAGAGVAAHLDDAEAGVAAHLGDAAAGAKNNASDSTKIAFENYSEVGSTAKTSLENYSEVGNMAKTSLENHSETGSTARERPIDALVCIGIPSRNFEFSEKRSEYPASPILREREVDIWVSNLRAPVLYLFPKAYVLGIGCRKGKSEAAIARAVEQATADLGLSPEDIVGVASIDLKKEEPGLVKFCQKRNLRFCTFPAETLAEVRGVFTGSSFVQSVTGVDNVCERAALCLAQKVSDESGRLILGKQAIDGVTVAVAERKWSVRF